MTHSRHFEVKTFVRCEDKAVCVKKGQELEVPLLTADIYCLYTVRASEPRRALQEGIANGSPGLS